MRMILWPSRRTQCQSFCGSAEYLMLEHPSPFVCWFDVFELMQNNLQAVCSFQRTNLPLLTDAAGYACMISTAHLSSTDQFPGVGVVDNMNFVSCS